MTFSHWEPQHVVREGSLGNWELYSWYCKLVRLISIRVTFPLCVFRGRKNKTPKTCSEKHTSKELMHFILGKFIDWMWLRLTWVFFLCGGCYSDMTHIHFTNHWSPEATPQMFSRLIGQRYFERCTAMHIDWQRLIASACSGPRRVQNPWEIGTCFELPS